MPRPPGAARPEPVPGPVPALVAMAQRASAAEATRARREPEEPAPERAAAPKGPVPSGLPLDQSHWDMRLSQMPREPKPDLAMEPFPAAPVTPRSEPLPELLREALPEARPEPRPPMPRPAARAQPTDTSVDVDVGPVEVRLRRASSGKRVAAWVLDGVPFLVAFAAVLRLALDSLPNAAPLDLPGYLELAGREAAGITGPIFAGTLVLFGVYHALSHGLGGATLGKRLVGIRLARRDGNPPRLGQATLRAVLTILSVVLVGLGVLLALFTPSGRALHDLLARTWVVEAP